jgi:hypothetical protein
LFRLEAIRLVKYEWKLDQIEDCVIVTRIVDTGEQTEDQQSILKVSRISRLDAFQGINEIRVSLDLLEKELRNAEAEDEKEGLDAKVKAKLSK